MRSGLPTAIVLTLVLGSLSSCGGDDDAGSDAGAPFDAGTDASGAGTDAGRDAGDDAGHDAGDDSGTDAGHDAGTDAGWDAGPDYDGGEDAGLIRGCPSYPDPVATVGEDIGGHTFLTWASPMFFEIYCNRCHSETLVTPEARMYAPAGLDFDVWTSVRREIPRIRFDVGVSNFMPTSAPLPTCAERYELLRWIDSGAPL